MNMAETIIKTILLIFVGAAALMDIKMGKLPVIFLAAGFCIGFILQASVGSRVSYDMILGCLPGIILLIIGKISKEAVGYGDGMLLIATGAYLGLFNNFLMLLFALVLSAALSALLTVLKKKKWSDSIPFAPFLLGGCVGILCIA